ncbi:AAA family ATPase [Accumulibacter sp.]|uniref:KGGVGR-motif variant AAA ATPase n=2 Tax=Accumulibacter sp. TaxID=2053492 RepID=UPI00260AAC35|nr:AAA family ATPase [Accumulibacter sp.]
MTAAQNFDQALPAALAVLKQRFPAVSPLTTIVRDAFGLLTVVLPDSALAEASDWDELADRLDAELGRYSPGVRRVLLRTSDLIDEDAICASSDRIRLPDQTNTWLLDRLQTNQDWLRRPLSASPPLPTAIAFSIKGGVGRTTALALWAWHLARQGKKVVVVDLDLEAPGLAGVLLDEDRMPDFGVVDWLIETLSGDADSFPLSECLGECALAESTPGRIRVLPAFGKRTKNYINKLGRVFMPVFSNDDEARLLGFAERLQRLLVQIKRLDDTPDAVLLDSRAGLHDISSAAITRLAAEVFMFARDDYQGWQAYVLLFDHLRHAPSIEWGMPDDDLRWRLKMVAAQVEPAAAARQRFVDRSYETWLALYDAEGDDAGVLGSATARLFEQGEDGPHQPLLVDFDPRVRSFDLSQKDKLPEWELVKHTFGDFFTGATRRLFPADADGEDSP